MLEFRELVVNGKFDKAYEKSVDMSTKEICDDLVAISFDSKNMLAYGYVEYVLLKEESAKYHWIANYLLLSAYVDIEGASQLGYLHIKKALSIDDTSFHALAALMGYASGPDNYATMEEYTWAKSRIAELYPDDPILEVPFGRGMTPEQTKKSRLSKDF